MTSTTSTKLPPPDQERIAAEIQDVHSRRADAWLRHDAQGYLSFYWDDATLFSSGVLLNYAELRQRITAFFDGGGGAVSMNLGPIDALAISPDGDAVTLSLAWNQRYRNLDGTEVDQSLCETDVWYRRDGVWKIISVHHSVPQA